MSVRNALVVLFSGLLVSACSFPDADEQRSEIASGQVLGERCFDDHSCHWEQPPSPAYPLITGVGEAICDVWLTVGEDGRAHDVSVDCDDPRFNRTTEIGLSTLKHRVKDSCGKPCSMIGRRIQYPIEYHLED